MSFGPVPKAHIIPEDSRSPHRTTMISRATAVLALAGSAAAFAPMGTPALRKPVSVSVVLCCAVAIFFFVLDVPRGTAGIWWVTASSH